MRIVVISDDHNRPDILERIVVLQKDADFFIHLGDGQGSILQVMEKYPDKSFVCVAGNCDFQAGLPAEKRFILGGISFYCTHGHLWGVSACSPGALSKQEVTGGARIVLFGHTHVRYCHCQDEIYYFNPGSCARPRDNQTPSYGVIDIVKGQPLLFHAQVPK